MAGHVAGVVVAAESAAADGVVGAHVFCVAGSLLVATNTGTETPTAAGGGDGPDVNGVPQDPTHHQHHEVQSDFHQCTASLSCCWWLWW